MSAANSQFDTAAIEAIVREVLRRVTNEATRLATATDFQADDETGNTLECSEKVIALETLRGKLNEITTIRLKPKTIVTPAVRDELRDHKIEIKFDLAVENQEITTQKILLGTTCKSTGAKLQHELTAIGADVELQTDDRVSRLATTIGNKVSTTLRAIMVTDQPYTAACVANRNANVRAVVVRDDSELAAVKNELNPNCIVLCQERLAQVNLSTILNLRAQ